MLFEGVISRTIKIDQKVISDFQTVFSRKPYAKYQDDKSIYLTKNNDKKQGFGIQRQKLSLKIKIKMNLNDRLLFIFSIYWWRQYFWIFKFTTKRIFIIFVIKMKKYSYALGLSHSPSQNIFDKRFTPKAKKHHNQVALANNQSNKCSSNLTQQILPKFTLKNYQDIKKGRNINYQSKLHTRISQSKIPWNSVYANVQFTNEDNSYNASRSGSIKRGNNLNLPCRDTLNLSSRTIQNKFSYINVSTHGKQFIHQMNPPKNNQPASARNLSFQKINNHSCQLASSSTSKGNDAGKIKKNSYYEQHQMSLHKLHSSNFIFESPQLNKQTSRQQKKSNQNIYQTLSNSVKKDSRQQLKKKIAENSAILQNFNSKIMKLNQKDTKQEKKTLRKLKLNQMSQQHQKCIPQQPKMKKSKKMTLLDEDRMNQKQNLTKFKCCFCQDLFSLKNDLNNRKMQKYIPCSAQKLLKRSPSQQNILKDKTLNRNKSQRKNGLRQAFYCPLTSSDYKEKFSQEQKASIQEFIYDHQLKKQYQNIVKNEDQWKERLQSELKNVQLRKSFTPFVSPLNKAGACSPYTQKSPILLSKYHKLLPQFEDIIYEQQSDLQEQQSIENIQNKLSIKHHMFIFNILDKQRLKILKKENCFIQQLSDGLKCFIGQILGKIKFKNQCYSFERFNQQMFDLSEELDSNQLGIVRSSIIKLYKRLKKGNQKEYPQVSQFTQSSQVQTKSQFNTSRVLQSLLTDRQILQNSNCSAKGLNQSNFSTQYNAESIVIQRASVQQNVAENIFPNQIRHFSNKIEQIQKVLNQKNDRVINLQLKDFNCKQQKSKNSSPSKLPTNKQNDDMDTQSVPFGFKRTPIKQFGFSKLNKTNNVFKNFPFLTSPLCKKISADQLRKQLSIQLNDGK